MGHQTNERRYTASARLLACPDCGAIWAEHSNGVSMLWRAAACCPLCKDGPELGRRRLAVRRWTPAER